MVEHVEAMHLKIKKHICDKCGHATSWPQCLAKHMFIMHGVGTGKIYTCDICGYVTKYRSNFKNHKKTKNLGFVLHVEKLIKHERIYGIMYIGFI